jgi:hypothetical protein
MEDPRLRKFRHQPREALFDLIPTLAQFAGPFTIDAGQYPASRSRAGQRRRPGIALVGDAYSTSRPAAGTRVNKVLTVSSACAPSEVPRGSAKDNRSAADVADFYADQVKVQCEVRIPCGCAGFTGTSRLRGWRGARFVVQSALGQLRGGHPDAAAKVRLTFLHGA